MVTCLLFSFSILFFEEVEFTANAKVLMQVCPSTAAMQTFHASCMHGRFLLPTFDMSSQHKFQRHF